MTYASPLPIDKNGSPMQEYPSPMLSKGRYGGENSSASSVITVGDNTTVVEVAAVTTSAVVKWIPTTDTGASVISIAGGTANFDHVVPAGTVRRFVIPIERQGATSSVVGANTQNGLYRRIAVKSTGVGSVLTAEF